MKLCTGKSIACLKVLEMKNEAWGKLWDKGKKGVSGWTTQTVGLDDAICTLQSAYSQKLFNKPLSATEIIYCRVCHVRFTMHEVRLS
jgi:hypothetical protein